MTVMLMLRLSQGQEEYTGQSGGPFQTVVNRQPKCISTKLSLQMKKAVFVLTHCEGTQINRF
jgi:hypothetical protein